MARGTIEINRKIRLILSQDEMKVRRHVKASSMVVMGRGCTVTADQYNKAWIRNRTDV